MKIFFLLLLVAVAVSSPLYGSKDSKTSGESKDSSPETTETTNKYEHNNKETTEENNYENKDSGDSKTVSVDKLTEGANPNIDITASPIPIADPSKDKIKALLGESSDTKESESPKPSNEATAQPSSSSSTENNDGNKNDNKEYITVSTDSLKQQAKDNANIDPAFTLRPTTTLSGDQIREALDLPAGSTSESNPSNEDCDEGKTTTEQNNGNNNNGDSITVPVDKITQDANPNIDITASPIPIADPSKDKIKALLGESTDTKETESPKPSNEATAQSSSSSSAENNDGNKNDNKDYITVSTDSLKQQAKDNANIDPAFTLRPTTTLSGDQIREALDLPAGSTSESNPSNEDFDEGKTTTEQNNGNNNNGDSITVPVDKITQDANPDIDITASPIPIPITDGHHLDTLSPATMLSGDQIKEKLGLPTGSTAGKTSSNEASNEETTKKETSDENENKSGDSITVSVEKLTEGANPNIDITASPIPIADPSKDNIKALLGESTDTKETESSKPSNEATAQSSSSSSAEDNDGNKNDHKDYITVSNDSLKQQAIDNANIDPAFTLRPTTTLSGDQIREALNLPTGSTSENNPSNEDCDEGKTTTEQNNGNNNNGDSITVPVDKITQDANPNIDITASPIPIADPSKDKIKALLGESTDTKETESSKPSNEATAQSSSSSSAENNDDNKNDHKDFITVSTDSLKQQAIDNANIDPAFTLRPTTTLSGDQIREALGLPTEPTSEDCDEGKTTTESGENNENKKPGDSITVPVDTITKDANPNIDITASPIPIALRPTTMLSGDQIREALGLPAEPTSENNSSEDCDQGKTTNDADVTVISAIPLATVEDKISTILKDQQGAKPESNSVSMIGQVPKNIRPFQRTPEISKNIKESKESMSNGGLKKVLGDAGGAVKNVGSGLKKVLEGLAGAKKEDDKNIQETSENSKQNAWAWAAKADSSSGGLKKVLGAAGGTLSSVGSGLKNFLQGIGGKVQHEKNDKSDDSWEAEDVSGSSNSGLKNLIGDTPIENVKGGIKNIRVISGKPESASSSSKWTKQPAVDTTAEDCDDDNKTTQSSETESWNAESAKHSGGLGATLGGAGKLVSNVGGGLKDLLKALG